MPSKNNDVGASKENLSEEKSETKHSTEEKKETNIEEKWLTLRVKSASKDLFDQYKITHKCDNTDSCIKELVEKATVSDELQPELTEKEDELNELKIKFADLRREFDKVQNMEPYVWILEASYSEHPVEEIQKLAQDAGVYRGAVAAFESGCDEKMVLTMFPTLKPEHLDLASKEAIANIILKLVHSKKVEVGVSKRETIFVTKSESFDIADYHKTISSPIISIYYSLWKRYKPNYKKDIEGYILDCVIDSMNDRGVVLTAAMPSIEAGLNERKEGS